MSNVVAVREDANVVHAQTVEYVPSIVVTLEQAAENLRKLDQIRREIMRPGIDYAQIPGTDKPTLQKPGAERLLQFFGLGHKVECINKIEDWEKGFFYYQYRVSILKQYPTHTIVVAECEGSANSKEKRYRNQDVFTIVNTLQKMAIKRALVGATLQATATSGFFTQDLEDYDEPPRNEHPTYQGGQRRNGNGRSQQASRPQAADDREERLKRMKELSELAEAHGLTKHDLQAIREQFTKDKLPSMAVIQQIEAEVKRRIEEMAASQEAEEIEAEHEMAEEADLFEGLEF
ncbi:hypothetical protein [Alicyclobacillus sendaiensis]|uniref:hypothetical protein n=1 Tax=Alicyclobacillus sendaiensis TaxID=192387 RepID=UPI0026F44808|nr:hypothetical protein [Alicyclobacillus sendaiensis]